MRACWIPSSKSEIRWSSHHSVSTGMAGRVPMAGETRHGWFRRWRIEWLGAGARAGRGGISHWSLQVLEPLLASAVRFACSRGDTENVEVSKSSSRATRGLQVCDGSQESPPVRGRCEPTHSAARAQAWIGGDDDRASCWAFSISLLREPG